MTNLIAYDLETTRIERGTPAVLYLTAYGDDNIKVSVPITGKNKKKTFCQLIEQYLLTEQNNGAQFIAWNGNKFDSYFVAEALLESDRWLIYPYMTASKALRGLRVKEKIPSIIRKGKRPKALQFEFLDGMAMTGITTSLDDKEVIMPDGKIKIRKGFLSTFAPDYRKLKSPNFEQGENFNPKNSQHVAYAERDSEGLYHAMKKVSDIMYDLTKQELKPTVGNLAIHHFMDNVPKNVELKRPCQRVLEHLHGPLKKGGYCWAAKQYNGPVWKYDMNQAYAAAMRDADLPCGDVVHTNFYEKDKAGIYQVEMERKKKCKVPFYYKDDKGGRFTTGMKAKCWLSSIEIEHLKNDGWTVEIVTGYYWSDHFNMKRFVDKLEKLRATDKEGPSGPLGTMVKALGNNAYGKTLEQVWGDEFIFAKEKPEGYTLYDGTDSGSKHIFAKERPSFPKKYHVPQIGVFITAHVRCVVREAAMYMEDGFLYADTDCIAFIQKARHLHLDPTRYGSWKVESAGELYIIIGKKVFYSEDGVAKAKGLIVKDLKKADYEDWLKGKIPIQVQTQRQNILKFLGGSDMFKLLKRRGTDVSKLKTVKVLHGEFIPV